MDKNIIYFKGENYFPISAAMANLLDLKSKGYNLYYRVQNEMTAEFDKQNLVYLKHSELIKYTKLLIESNKKISKTTQDQVLMVAEGLEQSLSILKVIGLNPVSFSMVDSIAKSIVDISFNPKLNSLLSVVLSGNYRHAFLRTVVTKAICQQMNWTSFSTVYKITLASMLGDLTDILGEEKFEEMAFKAGVSPEIIQIIKHIKENNDGSGPLKIKRHVIHPLAKVVKVAHEFSHKILVEKYNKDQFFNSLKSQTPQIYDSAVVNALKKFLDKN